MGTCIMARGCWLEEVQLLEVRQRALFGAKWAAFFRLQKKKRRPQGKVHIPSVVLVHSF